MTALLEVSAVSVTFDGFRAINNLSFAIGDGELRAIIGPNGAGKTTFMDIVTGKTRPDTGSVTWGERAINLLKLSEAQIARAGIGRKFQRPTVFEDQTVAENLMLALKAPRSPFAVRGWRAGARDHARVAEREQTTALLVDLAKTRAVVVVEHDMEFVRRLDCKVTVLHEGSVLAEGTLDHVTRIRHVIDVYLGR